MDKSIKEENNFEYNSETIVLEGDCGDSIEIDKEIEKKLLEKGRVATCKILLENNNYGSGFFCKIPIEVKKQIYKINMLFTNNHVLNNESIKFGKIIEFQYKNEKKIIKITEDRFCGTNDDLDYTFIQIFKEDGIEDFYEIENENENPNRDYFFEDICIMQYTKDLYLKVGHLIQIIEGQIFHSITSSKGSSGSPIILLLRDFKIIGIHRQFSKTLKLNRGTSMKYILEDINQKNLTLIENINKWVLR